MSAVPPLTRLSTLTARGAASAQPVVRAVQATASTATRAWQEVTTRVVTPRVAPRRLAGLEAMHVGHIEIDRLGRYIVVIGLVAACLMVGAWLRIDLRRTSMQLDRADAAFEAARAEHARLRLELATLQDPSHLHRVAAQLALQPGATIVDVSHQP